MMRLDPEKKAKLVAALRSGGYTQTQGRLTDGESYCCYGVACVLGGAERRQGDVPKLIYFDDRWDNLPRTIWEWLGLPSEDFNDNDGRVYIPVYPTDSPELWKHRRTDQEVVALDSLNDRVDADGNHIFPFSRIADLIEERL